MSTGSLVKRIQDIMRNDAGVDGDAQRISKMTWMFFLKVYDAKEQLWELNDENYKSIIPENLRWSNWAIDEKDGKALTGDGLLDLVNNQLFPTLKTLDISEETPLKQRSKTMQNCPSRRILLLRGLLCLTREKPEQT